MLQPELDPHEVAMFLRENPSLDKKMIGKLNTYFLTITFFIILLIVSCGKF